MIHVDYVVPFLIAWADPEVVDASKAATSIWYVGAAAMVTAICTGLGVLPFLVVSRPGKSFLGLANAAAAGLMIAASLGLLLEAWHESIVLCLVGLVAGALLLELARRTLPDDKEVLLESTQERRDSRETGKRIILFLFVMTVHSFAEGIGVGVSFAGREGFGQFISTAIAIHNIPEGLAIGLLMIPAGTSILRAGLWSIFSSLPQPLMAVPAYLFVTQFRPLLPLGLGLAAGAMTSLVVTELLPESSKQTTKPRVILGFTISFIAMWIFQILIA